MPRNRDRVLDVRDGLRGDLQRVRSELNRLNRRSASGLADSAPTATLAQLRFKADGLNESMERWVPDAYKVTDDDDTPTGAYLYYDSLGDVWRHRGTDEVVYTADRELTQPGGLAAMVTGDSVANAIAGDPEDGDAVLWDDTNQRLEYGEVAADSATGADWQQDDADGDGYIDNRPDIQDDGTPVSSAWHFLNFVGATVTADGDGIKVEGLRGVPGVANTGARGQSIGVLYHRAAAKPSAPAIGDFVSANSTVSTFPSDWSEAEPTGTATLWAIYYTANASTVAVGPVFAPPTVGGLSGVTTHRVLADDIAIDVGDTVATVTWPPPGSEGYILSSYELESRQGSSGTFTRISDITVPFRHLTGLVNGQSYQARVRAVNEEDLAGPWSALRSFTPASADTAPHRPAPVTLVAAENGFSVSWLAPYSGGTPIRYYNLRYTLAGCCDYIEVVGFNSLSKTLSALLPDRLYEVEVQAVNAGGHSLWSVPTIGETLGADARYQVLTWDGADLQWDTDPGSGTNYADLTWAP